MSFTGEYEHSIDAKLRVAIPAEIRARLDPEVHGSGFYLVHGPNGALWMWPQRTFERMTEAQAPTLLPSEESMEYDELLFSQAAQVEIDGSGRVRLSERLLRRAGISGSSVMILGVKDHLELRDPKQWEQRREAQLARHGEIQLRATRAMQERARHQSRNQ